MSHEQPDWRCHLPGSVGLRYYQRWKRAQAGHVLARLDAALADMPRNALCLDLGANVGTFSLRMAAAGARVISFEPDPETFDVLVERTASEPRIEPRQAAVGDRTGTAQLFRAKGYPGDKIRKSLGASIARTDPFAMDRRNQVTIPVKSLGNVLDEFEEPVHILKMDIEGSEWPLLAQLRAGLGRDRTAHVFVETHERFAPFSLMPQVLEFERSFRGSSNPAISITWP